MGRKWPVQDIPEPSNVLEAGLYLMTIAAISEEYSRDKHKLMYNVELRVKDGPSGIAPGTPYFERFVIGTDNDPSAEQPETWKMQRGSKYLRQMMLLAGTKPNADIDKMIAAAIDREVGVVLRVKKVPPANREGVPNPRAGEDENNIAEFFQPGQKKVGGAVPKKVAPPAAAKRPAPDEDEDEDEDEAPPPKKRPAPVAAADEDEDEDEDAPPPPKKGKPRRPVEDDEDDDD